jgi:hypothetical protein
MIDTINGELRGSESYDNFSDIMFDLQLMLDMPKTYLRDIASDNASSNGLDPVFAEKRSLQCCNQHTCVLFPGHQSSC